MTLAELRAAREKAGADVVRLSKESQAEGFTSTADWEAGWTKANADYNAALAAEETEVARLDRAESAARVAADATRMSAAGRNTLRPDYTPTQPESRTPTLRLPASARRHGQLRAFRGPDAEFHAYATGQWAAAALLGHAPSRAWCAANGIAVEEFGGLGQPRATTLTTTNSAVAYLVPEVTENAIIRLAEEYGVLRRSAQIVPMEGGVKNTPRWTGGMTAYFVGEGVSPTESNPAYDMIQLVAKDVAAKCKLSRNLSEDAIVDFGDEVSVAMAIAFASLEDNAGFLGDGTSTYGGIHGLFVKLLVAANSACLAQAAAGHDTIAELDVDDYLAAVGKIARYPGLMPKWYVANIVWATSMQSIALNMGGVTPADVAQGRNLSFLGYPVELVNVLPTTYAASSVAAALADLRMSTKLGARRGLAIEAGMENDDFSKQLFTMLGTTRLDINNHTLTDPRDSAKAGPVVAVQLSA